MFSFQGRTQRCCWQGGTESRSLEPSGESRERGVSMRGGLNPPLIRGAGGPPPEIFCKIYVSENAFQAILKLIFPYSITSVLTKVRHSNTFFFAFNLSFHCHPLDALIRLCFFIVALPWPTKYLFKVFNDCSSS